MGGRLGARGNGGGTVRFAGGAFEGRAEGAFEGRAEGAFESRAAFGADEGRAGGNELFAVGSSQSSSTFNVVVTPPVLRFSVFLRRAIRPMASAVAGTRQLVTARVTATPWPLAPVWGKASDLFLGRLSIMSLRRTFALSIPFLAVVGVACGSSSGGSTDAGGTSAGGAAAGGAGAGGAGGSAAGGMAAGGQGGSMGGGAQGGSAGSTQIAGLPKEPDVVDCKKALAAPAAGVCNVVKGSKTTVIQGRVVGTDHVYEGGEIVLDDKGMIACVACDCSATAGYTGATTLTCKDGVVTPALINAHEHLTYSNIAPQPASPVRYDYRNQWRKGLDGKPKITVAATQSAETVWFGAMRHALGGVGSISGDEGSPKAGVTRFLDKTDPLQGGLASKAVDVSVFPLGDTSEPTGGAKACTDFKPQDSQATIDGDDPYEPHVSEGVSARSHLEFTCLNGSAGAPLNVVKKQTAMIHGVALTPADIASMASNGTGLVWSPRSNISLYGFTASVTTMARAGVQIALGTDWTPSGSTSLLRELNCAASFNTTNLGGFFSDYQLYRMVTEDAAGVLDRDAKIGKLAVGFFGDVTIWNGAGKAPFAAVTTATLPDIALVLRGGASITGEAAAVDALSPDGGAGCEALTDCLASHKVCSKRETGLDVAALQTAAKSPYALFFCGTPTNEPTCVPSRPMEFTGVPAADDKDGDGVKDASDICPTVFDPARPMDNGKQADADGDGVGDACDPCPMQANVTDCMPTVNWTGGSGTGGSGAGGSGAGGSGTAGTGGSGTGGSGPPMMVTVPMAKTLADGDNVVITGLCVTAVRAGATNSSVWVQDPTLMADAGIVAFSNVAPTVVEGDKVDVSGPLTTFNGLREIGTSKVAPTITKTGTCSPMIAPLVVMSANVATGGADMTKYMSMLLEVDNVSEDMGPDMAANEFVVTGGLHIDDYIYAYPAASYPMGTNYAKIVGVLDYFKDHSKIDPRTMGDLVTKLASRPSSTRGVDERSSAPLFVVIPKWTLPETLALACTLTLMRADALTAACAEAATHAPAWSPASPMTFGSCAPT